MAGYSAVTPLERAIPFVPHVRRRVASYLNFAPDLEVSWITVAWSCVFRTVQVWQSCIYFIKKWPYKAETNKWKSHEALRKNRHDSWLEVDLGTRGFACVTLQPSLPLLSSGQEICSRTKESPRREVLKFFCKNYARIIKVQSPVNKITFKWQIGINSISKRSMIFSWTVLGLTSVKVTLICTGPHQSNVYSFGQDS